MKYIIFDDPQAGEFAVFCLAPQTHAQMATAWRRDPTRRVVSAGFCEFVAPVSPRMTGENRGQPPGGEHAATRPCTIVRVFGRSESLNLGNRGAKDAALITAMYLGTVAMARRADVAASAVSARRAVSQPGGAP